MFLTIVTDVFVGVFLEGGVLRGLDGDLLRGGAVGRGYPVEGSPLGSKLPFHVRF